jgi:hypothetical protein
VSAINDSEDPNERATRADIFKKRRHRRMSNLACVVKLRGRAGLDETPFTPLPIVAPPWSRVKWYLRIAEIARVEAALYNDLDALLSDAERLALLLDVKQ